MTPAQLRSTVLRAARRAAADGELPPVCAGPEPTRVTVESPPRSGSGADYATNVALRLASAAGRPPLEVARPLAVLLRGEPGIARADVAGPGFLDVTLDADARAALLRTLIGAAAAPVVPDAPARDAAAWSRATGEDAAGLLTRTAAASSLFRVQYAHARARSVLRNAARLGLVPEPGAGGHAYDAPAERALLSALADSARHRGAGLARHLDHVSAELTGFAEAHPPLPSGEEDPRQGTAVHRARLALAEAAAVVLADGLDQLGVTAPAHL